MPEALKQLFGISGTLLAIYAIIPYIADIKKGNTKPHKMDQIIFMIIAGISFFGQLQEGATASLYLTAYFFFLPFIILYLSRNTKIGSITKPDIFTLILCLFVLLVWALTESAALAIILITFVNFIAKVLVMIKVYKYPDSELLITWNLAIVASLLTVLSVGEFDWILILTPLHNAVTVAIISGIIINRKKIGTHA